MIIDSTIQDIIDKVIVDVKDDLDIELSDAKVLEIINSQFSGVPNYTKEKKVIKFDYFGKFQIKEGREEYVTKGRLKNIMTVLGELQLLPDYRYVIEDREEVDYHSIVKFIDSQIKMKIDKDVIISKIKVIIEGNRVPLKHLTND